MSEKRKRARIELLDVAKAITIFLVILGHTTSNTDTIMYRRVIYSFHMPLFFILAGLSTKPRAVVGVKVWRAFLKKNVLALVVPFIVWGLIYAPFTFQNFPKLFYASWASLGAMGTLTSLWYLVAFFIARTFVQILVSVMSVGGLEGKRMRIACAVCAVPMFAIGFLLPYLEQGYPWCLDVSFVAAGFILIGMAIRHAVIILAVQRGRVQVATLAISLVILCLGTLVRGDGLGLVLMCGAQYGNLFWLFIISLAGTMVVISISTLLVLQSHEGARPFSLAFTSFIGAHTMGVFLIHKPILQEILMPFFSGLIPGPQLIAALVASVFALSISMLLCIIIEAYLPEILGQFPSYATTEALVAEKIREAKAGSKRNFSWGR